MAIKKGNIALQLVVSKERMEQLNELVKRKGTTKTKLINELIEKELDLDLIRTIKASSYQQNFKEMVERALSNNDKERDSKD